MSADFTLPRAGTRAIRAGEWTAGERPGESLRPLIEDASGHRAMLLKVAPGPLGALHAHETIEQIYVLEGDFFDDEASYTTGDFVVRMPGTMHRAGSRNGCTMLIVLYSIGGVCRMTRFSAFSLFAKALGGHQTWPEQWPDAAPKAEYEAIIVGAGGHGLGAAYYLAKKYGITRVAVIEKGWLGGGNTGRNTTIIRSNYLYDESAHLYDHAVKLWDGLSAELNYNTMYSKRGVMMLAHNVHDIQSFKRHIHANRLNGVDNEWLTPEQAKAYCPPLNIASDARHPVLGAALQRRGGTARHDTVAWGYARAAAALGVDIIQNCAVTGIRRGADGAVQGVETERGFIASKRIGVSAAGNTSVIMRMAGLDFPLESYPLQALVSEPVKPVFPCVVMSNTVHAYMSQSDKGELVIGAGTDQYVSYSQRGALHIIEHTLAAICEIFPIFRRMRMLRTWGGIVDVTPDRSPVLGKTPVPGLYVNCGWGTGGFKATPGAGDLLAYTMAKDEPHAINAPFNLDRFCNGRLIDEAAAAAVAH